MGTNLEHTPKPHRFRRIAGAVAGVTTLAIAFTGASLAFGAEEAALPAAGPSDTRTDTTRATPATGDSGSSSVLTDLDQVVPTAKPGAALALRGAPRNTISAFMTHVLNDVDRYWTASLTNNGYATPNVTYDWTAPGVRKVSECVNDNGTQVISTDTSAFYCPADDTILISEQVAYDLWIGTIHGPNGTVKSNRTGDFAVAYLVAHEFAHSIQNELKLDRKPLAPKALELHADCWSGAWANSAYYKGVLEAGDIEEALEAATQWGDFDYTGRGHHGTPAERVAAFNLGYNTGRPANCSTYLR